ncbi:hypothetical protein ACIGKR_23915 [Rhodococcus qingshengii]|uniref:hypothetical protein n=1 Tax=Rhodococcus qingshengii TaxID=334542 RepID=UPI0037CB4C08
MGRNEIARELNVSPRHVTAASRLLGLKFDDSGIRDALEARRTRHQDRMSKIAEEFAKAAEQRLEELKKVTPGDAHKLTLAAAIATDKAQQLWAKYDDGDPTLGDDTLEGE